jgi:hypothetical protein
MTMPPAPAASATERRPKPFYCRLPAWFYLGTLMTACAWISSWARIGPWPYTYFPLWFGFILLLDGLNLACSGSSPLSRSRQQFVIMFLVSAPCWWIFEVMNFAVLNWHYVLDQDYPGLVLFLLASLYFSTALPAIFELAELLATWKRVRPRNIDPSRLPALSRSSAACLFGIGAGMVMLPVIVPHYAFWLIWLSVIFLSDPINTLAGRKSIVGRIFMRDWGFFAVIPLATLICGFFWELWNYWALPRWYYTIPWFDAGPHLFELPLPGYLAYLLFGLDLYAMYHVALKLMGFNEDALTF